MPLQLKCQDGPRERCRFFIGPGCVLVIGGEEEEWKEVGESKIEMRHILYYPHDRASAVN